ncbi:Transcription factor BOA15 [Pseudocercospora fuligena]|uniref:Transcription factor BOA15 n=1 Tax=Pseudocercospora fuligena TaxID=685502 RepID=A0A8H6VHQ0_9PEZI|nr:Transcription factor BOA15 [Pseudocercospora fuligena]
MEIDSPSTHGSRTTQGKPWIESLFLDAELLPSQPNAGISDTLAGDRALRQVLEREPSQREWLLRVVETLDFGMSIIPYRQLSAKLEGPVAILNSEDVLLLACIRLHAVAPPEDDPRTSLYQSIKSSLISSEINGGLSISLLQAQVIVLYYEFGHGIYPAAYFTLGRCVQSLTALEIDVKASEERFTRTWIEIEHRRRLWWAVFVMERCIALGKPDRPLSMPEPNSNSILPCDEKSWTQEIPPLQASTLATPLTYRMGNFRLFALTSHLLGQAILNHADSLSNQEQRHETTMQLYRTLLALETVIEEEAQQTIMEVGAPRSLLNSTKMLLFSCPRPSDFQLTTESPVVISANLFLERSRIFIQGELMSADRASPFLLHWGYHTLNHFYRLYGEDGRQENNEAIQVLEETFHQLDKRWKLAGKMGILTPEDALADRKQGVYMKLIHARHLS